MEKKSLILLGILLIVLTFFLVGCTEKTETIESSLPETEITTELTTELTTEETTTELVTTKKDLETETAVQIPEAYSTKTN